ncbi:type ISP restriction/modification enzyme [Actinacidiphila acididurans]|uniref:DNA methyltransferase n=1 Tax=Actinacidiphila acididurans TaxID=2784346 RepID=A0ABS2TRY1_9ACTN|nr:type ISP restriction/modification enzyme [Actinacidiphila acididurans]MBM9506103.1 DNA methyltransferase [Actinacidiphila acididurans]
MPPVSDEAPLLHDLMPWSVRPLRIGRNWPLAPDPGALKARWALLTAAPDEAAKAALLHPTRARTLHTPVAQLPGHRTPTTALAREDGPCPEPVRVQHGPFDQQWLIPDHRLIDAARPELWRVADDRQVFALEQAYLPEVAEPPVVFCAPLPDGRSPAGKPARIRPLYRQPGGLDPNLAPGLAEWLTRRLGVAVAAEDILAWVAAAARATPEGCAVPLTGDPVVWQEGLALGRRSLWLHTRGARYADPAAGRDRLRLPGGSRPYVRAPLPATPKPGDLAYDPQEQALRIGEGVVAPVSAGAWERTAGGVRVLDAWYERRTDPGEPGSLEALRPAGWSRTTTSELLELVSVLTLLAEARAELDAFAGSLAGREGDTVIGAGELRAAGILPVAEARRRPASVLEHHEEGPDGQFPLL